MHIDPENRRVRSRTQGPYSWPSTRRLRQYGAKVAEVLSTAAGAGSAAVRSAPPGVRICRAPNKSYRVRRESYSGPVAAGGWALGSPRRSTGLTAAGGTEIKTIEEQVEVHFGQHPDAKA
jgi:hypothetical protein